MFRMLQKLCFLVFLNKLIQIGAAYTIQNLYLDLNFPKNLEELHYNGKVSLQFSVEDEVQQIALDADIDDIGEIKVYKNGTDENIFKGREYSRENQRLHIFFYEALIPVVFHSIDINFSNRLRTDFTGFYILQYKNEQDKSEYLMSTQLKPNYIRRAFPCFDAPHIRGLVHLTVTANRNLTVVFNSGIQRKDLTSGNNDFNTIVFHTTELMLIHLLSLSIMRLKSLSISNYFTFNVYGRDSCHANFALNTTILLRSKMLTYVAVAALPTLIQLVALPTDTAVASKTWGSIIFREEDISFNELETTSIQQVQIVIEIARALAQSYFGTIVVPRVWNQIWLNDGFANWLAYKIVDVAYPEWDVYQFFLINEYQKALINDALPSTEPIVPGWYEPLVYIEDPHKNAILAAKSASFLRMLEYKIGYDKFKSLIRQYVRSGGFVEDYTFIKLWSVANDFYQDYAPLREFIYEKGYSLVNIERNYSTGKINLIQSPMPDEKVRNKTWLPVTIVSIKNLNLPVGGTFYSPPDYNCEIIETEISGLKDDDWILGNYHQTAYSRTNYDERNWQLLSNALNDDHTKFQANDRAQLLDNAFKLAELDILPYEISLNLSLYLTKEKEFSPWATADKFLASLERLLTGHAGQQLFYRYVHEITKPIFNDMHLKETSKDSIILKTSRGIVTYWACRSWNVECYCEAKKLFKKYLEDDKLIVPNLRRTVLCSSIRSAARKELDKTWQKMFRSRRRFERFDTLYLLGCSHDEHFLEDLINHIFNAEAPEDYFIHERMQIISKIVDKGPQAVLAAIKALRKPHILQLLLSDKTLAPALQSISQNVFSRAQENMVRDLVQDLLAKQFLPRHEYDTIVEQLKNNMNWVEHNRKEVLDWLSFFDASIPGDFEGSSSREEPECKLPPSESRNCGCGCGCEDSAFKNKPSYSIVSVLLITSYLMIQ